MHAGPFGSCCADLREAMTQPPESFFRVEQNGVFYLTVGYVATADGPGFFDQAVLHCPFCGVQLQDRDAIARAAAP
jgi:hypothetical protein